MVGETSKKDVLECAEKMMKTYPLEFKRGINKTEMKTWFPRFMGYSLSEYQNRMRDNVKDKTMGRHDCPSTTREKRRFFPLSLHEQGLVDHSRCWNCEIPLSEASPK